MGTVVTKEVSFDAAHFLSDYDGPCHALHGHRWTLLVSLSGPVNPSTGMIVDFAELSSVLKEHVVSRFDHQCINFVAPELKWRATAELMAMYIAEQLLPCLPEGVELSRLVLYETPTSFVEYIPEDDRGILAHVSQKQGDVEIGSAKFVL